MRQFIQSTKTKLKVQGATIKIALFLVFVFGFIAPYAHIPFNTNDSEGVFGFTYMSSFLFAIGFPIFLVCISVLLFYASGFMPIQLKKLFRVFSVLSGFTGFYFLVWAMNPLVEKDFHPAFYYGSMILISSVLAHSTIYIQTYLETTKRIIRYLVDIIVIDARPYVKDNNKYIENIVKPVISKIHEEAK